MASQISIQEAQAEGQVAALPPDAARVRVEIDEFLGDNDMTNLYLLALEAMQQEDPTKSAANNNEDWWTFYSLSGIHGMPSESWDGVPNKGAYGYCTHGELVFPTWHRVYMAMFEQAVVNKMQEIANQYTKDDEKRIYQSAANRFRLPFWDPFLPRNKVEKSSVLNPGIWGIPQILGAKSVWVKRPGADDLEPMDNPLYQFGFPSQDTLDEKGRVPVNFGATRVSRQGWNHTIRTPGPDGETNVYGTGAQDRAGLNLKIQRQAMNSSTKLWKLLSRYNKDRAHNNESRTWASFASHWVSDPRTQKPILDERGNPIYQQDTAISLESWHDDIHGLVGTGSRYGGHMGDPSIAGFDPIFWLHHCNIDRILAIYQALYPDKWLPASGSQSATSKLYPFRKSQGANDYWISNEVRDWKTLGYAIPGNKDLNEQGLADLEKHLHEYYSWATEGSYPPPSVADKWPRDLSKSVALHGSKAHPAPKPLLQFEALATSGLVSRSIAVPTPESPSIDVVDKPKSIVIDEKTPSSAPETIQNGKLPTWNARIRVKKFAFDGSFNIHLFIGGVEDDQPERFITKKNEVGFSSIFASPPNAPCANCVRQREEGFMYEDAIPITPLLYDYLHSNTATDGPDQALRTLESFQPDQVVPFLKKNLEWRITDLASNLINDQQRLTDSGLEISVSVRDFDLPTPDHPLGVYYPPVTHQEITQDKVGGFGYTAA